jgi:hypothetical protein
MRLSTTICVSAALCGATGWAKADVWVEGATTDCGLWVAARKKDRADALENWLIGTLDGMAIGTDKDFWRKGGQVSREAVFLWMDNYCQSHPLNSVISGTDTLFRERTGWSPSPRPSKRL